GGGRRRAGPQPLRSAAPHQWAPSARLAGQPRQARSLVAPGERQQRARRARRVPQLAQWIVRPIRAGARAERTEAGRALSEEPPAGPIAGTNLGVDVSV